MNKVILSGALGRDPEVRYMPNGDAVANFSVATTEKWKDRSTGEIKEDTEWHRCVAYRKTAETIGKYFTKGSGIIISEGRLKTRKYTDAGGVERYVTEVIVDEFDFPPGARNPGAHKPGNTQGSAPSENGNRQPAMKQDASFADQDDKIPFV